MGQAVTVGFFRRAFDRFSGQGSAAVTIPAMDGPLRPNARLDDARVLAELSRPDSLAQSGGNVYVTSGASLCRIDPMDGSLTLVETFDSNIVSMAASPDGLLALGLNGGRIEFRGGDRAMAPLSALNGAPIVCPTALAFDGANALYVCLGSRRRAARDWQRGLIEHDVSGSVWRVSLNGEASACIADELAFPYGILVETTGSIVVSESWRHRLIRIAVDQRRTKPQAILTNLPGYPARLTVGASGHWLAVFAPRSQLIEFVLREHAYAARMMREIADPNLWIAPALSSRHTFLEPMQGGGVMQLGILKPWAPSRSYGLAVRLDANFLPIDSFHSRADGAHHGVLDALERDGRLIVASSGGNRVLSLTLDPQS